MRPTAVEALEYVLDVELTSRLMLAERAVMTTLALHAERAKSGVWRWKTRMTGEQLSDLSGVSLRHTSLVTNQLIDARLVDRVLGQVKPGGREPGSYYFGPKP